MNDINRCYCYDLLDNPILETEIHAFSDASKRIFATCVYLRFKLKSGEIKTNLVVGKSKILDASKKITIPRAELNAVLLMSQVYSELS